MAAIMASVGQAVARRFQELPSLPAYRLDLLGSLVGIIVFGSLSFTGAPPFVWGLIVATMIFFLVNVNKRRTMVVAASLWLALLAIESMAPNTSWSPYYKLKLIPIRFAQGHGHVILANGISHQVILPQSALAG